MPHGERLISMKVLMVDDELTEQSASGRASRALARELRDRDVTVVEATSADDGQAVVLSDPSLQGVVLDWALSDDDTAHDKAKALLALIRSRNLHIPIFLTAERDDAASLTARGLRPCSRNELKWTAVPGFVQGMQYDVDMSCAKYDPNFPAARVYLAKFDSAEARDGALRNFETINQRRIGAGFARAIGPWILVVDGNQRTTASALVREVLSDLGVN